MPIPNGGWFLPPPDLLVTMTFSPVCGTFAPAHRAAVPIGPDIIDAVRHTEVVVFVRDRLSYPNDSPQSSDSRPAVMRSWSLGGRSSAPRLPATFRVPWETDAFITLLRNTIAWGVGA